MEEIRFPIRTCHETENHTDHEWVDGIDAKYCPGRAETKIGQSRLVIPEKKPCVSDMPHECHIWDSADKTASFYCDGVAIESPLQNMGADQVPVLRDEVEQPTSQKWPCDRLIIHEPHESADGKRHCMGITNDEYIKHIVPVTEPPFQVSYNSTVWCYDRTSHEPHMWRPVNQEKYANCPGIAGSDAVLLEHGIVAPTGKFYCKNVKGCLGHIPTVPLTGGGEYITSFCGLHGPHEPHTWHKEDSPLDTVRKCPGYRMDEVAVPSEAVQQLEELKDRVSEIAHNPEKASKPKWVYVCETYDDGNVTKIVRKRGDGKDPNWESTLVEYHNAVYARIVADALNGGVILGFEVEK